MSGKVVVRQEGAKVLLNLDDRAFAELEPRVAERVGRALIEKARLAEEVEHAEKIAFDSAILLRAGSNFCLSSHPKIVDMAKTEAAHNRDLRRYIPSIRSTEAFGLPSLIQKPPAHVTKE